jgi:hypothetical protein
MAFRSLLRPSSPVDTKDHVSQKADNSALSTFKSKVNLGVAAPIDSTVDTIHQNTITCISPLGSDFSTSGLDGSLGIWKIKTLESKLKGLKIA